MDDYIVLKRQAYPGSGELRDERDRVYDSVDARLAARRTDEAIFSRYDILQNPKDPCDIKVRMFAENFYLSFDQVESAKELMELRLHPSRIEPVDELLHYKNAFEKKGAKTPLIDKALEEIEELRKRTPVVCTPVG